MALALDLSPAEWNRLNLDTRVGMGVMLSVRALHSGSDVLADAAEKVLLSVIRDDCHKIKGSSNAASVTLLRLVYKRFQITKSPELRAHFDGLVDALLEEHEPLMKMVLDFFEDDKTEKESKAIAWGIKIRMDQKGIQHE